MHSPLIKILAYSAPYRKLHLHLQSHLSPTSPLSAKQQQPKVFPKLTINLPIKIRAFYKSGGRIDEEAKDKSHEGVIHALPQRNARRRTVVTRAGGGRTPAQQSPRKKIPRVSQAKMEVEKERHQKKEQQRGLHTVLFCLFAWLTPCQGLAANVPPGGDFSKPPLPRINTRKQRGKVWGWSFFYLAFFQDCLLHPFCRRRYTHSHVFTLRPSISPS